MSDTNTKTQPTKKREILEVSAEKFAALTAEAKEAKALKSEVAELRESNADLLRLLEAAESKSSLETPSGFVSFESPAPKANAPVQPTPSTEDYHTKRNRDLANEIKSEQEAARNRSLEARVAFAQIRDPIKRAEFFRANRDALLARYPSTK